MATSTKKNARPVFINTNLVVAGSKEANDVIADLNLRAEEANNTAMTALQTGDRKGVLLQMKLGGIYTATASRLEKALQRAQRVRLTKDERKAFEADGTLPEGVQQVIIEDDEEDEDNDDEK